MTKKKSAFIPCTPKQLPPELQEEAYRTAVAERPDNAVLKRRVLTFVRQVLGLPDEATVDKELFRPAKIAVLRNNYWGAGGVNLTVGFVSKASAALQEKIVASMNKWRQTANVTFTLTGTPRSADVRISLAAGGYWSYLGTDIRHIPASQQTMNLEAFSLTTPDSEYDRVVCHETGHTLGFPHEHMRPALVALLDRQKTIAYFQRTQGWSAQEVQEQVLTPLSEASLISTPPDQDSIMCYQLPGSITQSGQPIHGGMDINPTDAAFAARIYPKPDAPPPPPSGGSRYLIESASEISFTKQ